MLILIKSRSGSQLGNVGSKTRSLGQIIEKSCVHYRGHSFDRKFIKHRLVRMLIIIISRSNVKPGHVGSKTRSLLDYRKSMCTLERAQFSSS